MPTLDPERASLLGRIGAHVTNSRHDGRALTAAARAAFLETFLDEVDPDRELPEAERLRRAEHARSAFYARIVLKRHEEHRKRQAEQVAP